MGRTLRRARAGPLFFGVALGLGAFGAIACSSDASPSSSPRGDAGDLGNTSGSPGSSGLPGTSGNIPFDSGPTLPGAHAITVTPRPSITMPKNVVTMAGSDAARRLYVSMQEPTVGGVLGAPAGVLVFDPGTNAQIATVPAPVENTQPQTILNMAVDEVANKVYLSGSPSTIWVLDGNTNTIQPQAINVSSQPLELLVDPAAHRLYAWLYANDPAPQSITVFDTTNDTLVTTIPVSDLGEGPGKLALDPTSHTLFACSTPIASQLATLGAAVDVIDTATNTIRPPQKTYPAQPNGYFVGCGGGPGYASLVTGGASNLPAALIELEPATTTLPVGFAPDAVATAASTTPGLHLVTIAGHDRPSDAPELAAFLMQGEQVGAPPIVLHPIAGVATGARLSVAVTIQPQASSPSRLLFLAGSAPSGDTDVPLGSIQVFQVD